MTPPRRASPSRWRLALYGVLPALVLLAAAETAVRVLGLDAPAVRNVGLPEERVGLIRLDGELFWALRPGVDVTVEGGRAVTNDLGLRGPAVLPKRGDEFRILSLGESSTFGVAVGNDETYTSVLERGLRGALPGRAITTINAGVPAYSSFQSLKYLEGRGLALRPDLVLVYHELNDYLPSTIRDSSDNEFGVLRTDRQLYEARTSPLRRVLVHSALVRFLTFRLAAWRLEDFRRREAASPVTEVWQVGIPGLGPPPGAPREPGKEFVLAGRRVSEEERRQNLAELVAFGARHGIRVVLIHPSYRDSAPHECLLTRFARESGTPLFEAYPALHPAGVAPGALFVGHWHPDREGHRRLGEALAAFLLERGLIPARGT